MRVLPARFDVAKLRRRDVGALGKLGLREPERKAAILNLLAADDLRRL